MRSGVKSALIAVALLVLSVATVIVGTWFKGLSYYIIVTLILIYALIGFFAYFERGEHRERELVMIGIMCAIAVAARAAFIWVPHFKPMAAIIMIAGIAFGARSGFLVGALAVLLSNLLFGQGPWTPWQMVSFGLCGLLFGLLADSKLIPRYSLPKSKLMLVAVLGALEVLLISGPVLDIYALTSIFNIFTFEGVLGVLLAGVPVNAIHAAATFITILLLGNPLLNIIHRARIKYGLAESTN